MDIINLRQEFTVYVVEPDLTSRNQIGDILSGVRFQTETFSSHVDALKKIQEIPPHIVFVSGNLNFVEEVRRLSTDIEVIFLVAGSERGEGVEALRRGAYTYVIKPFENSSEVITAADRVMENIYLRMENEQLLQEMSKTPESEVSGVGQFFQKLMALKESDPIIHELVSEISRANSGIPVIFLKFLPIYQTLAITASAQVHSENIQGVGIQLDKYDPKEVPHFLENPAAFKELSELMAEVFHCPEFAAIPLKSELGPIGIIVVFAKNPSSSTGTMVTAASFQHNTVLLNAKLKEVGIRDALTGLYNRSHFMEKLDEEINRCVRTHYPVSFIHVDIDDFNNYSLVNGAIMADIVIKTISQIISKTGRRIDAPVRWGPTEFGVLCPSTPGVGAAIKAEKMRLTIEGTKFPLSNKQPLGKITVSIGVSEYPTIAGDGPTLLKSAANALFQVKQGGKNRVCLAEAPTGFKPDFAPLPVPGFKKRLQNFNPLA